jgi:hypothetical protein
MSLTLSQKIAAWHDEWVKTATFTVDPSYSEAREDSQYPELVEDTTPTPESDAVYWEGVKKIIASHKG